MPPHPLHIFQLPWQHHSQRSLASLLLFGGGRPVSLRTWDPRAVRPGSPKRRRTRARYSKTTWRYAFSSSGVGLARSDCLLFKVSAHELLTSAAGRFLLARPRSEGAVAPWAASAKNSLWASGIRVSAFAFAGGVRRRRPASSLFRLLRKRHASAKAASSHHTQWLLPGRALAAPPTALSWKQHGWPSRPSQR